MLSSVYVLLLILLAACRESGLFLHSIFSLDNGSHIFAHVWCEVNPYKEIFFNFSQPLKNLLQENLKYSIAWLGWYELYAFCKVWMPALLLV